MTYVCLSRHDISYNKNKNKNNDEISKKIKEFIDKYKRRHERLIELIKTTTQKICFIYYYPYKEFDYDDSIVFNKIITSINKNIEYVLVLLIDSDEDLKYTKTEYLLKINLKHFTNKNIEYEWTLQMFDWKGIFDLIKNVTNN
jgi:transposase-like protein